MKQVSLFLAAFLTGLLLPSLSHGKTCQSGDETHYLVVTLSDASESRFALADTPLLTFDAATLVVTAGGTEVSFDLNNVTDYHFEKKEVITGINKPATDNGDEVRPSINAGEVALSGLKEGTPVTVYAIDGQIVTRVQAGTDGKAIVDLRNLSNGVYILRTPTKSFKIKN